MGTDPPLPASSLRLARLHEETVALNEALLLGSVRQHVEAEEAERSNALLRAEITVRRRAEAALRESEERYRTLFASAPMAVFVCDQNAVIQQCNSRAVEIWGRAPVLKLERCCGSLRMWRPDGTFLPHDRSPIREVLRTGRPALDFEIYLERPDGARVPVLMNFAALRDGEGNVTGAIGSFTDLTEHKKLEQQSLRSQRLESIGTLAGGIAHDLNNSFGPILISLNLLRENLVDPASQELLALVEASAQRGAEMVRRILAFAQGVEGQHVLVRVPELVREIEKIVRESFLQQIQLATRIPAGLWTVLGDSTQLHQVLLNLCLNARDAMPMGGALVISAENCQIGEGAAGLRQNPKARPGPYVAVQVQDSGTGMPPEVMEKIFDPFFTTKEVGQGTGLGLPTSLAIIKSHAGFLQVTSEPGQGTTFQMFLPAQTEAAPPAPALAPPARPRGDGETILVVDDEAPMRQLTKKVLELYGYRVLVACDGAEAVSIYSEQGEEIAAVLTDMTMPVMDGAEAIRVLWGMDPNLVIIAASGIAMGRYAPILAGLGVRHILSKPYETDVLLQMLEKALLESRPAKAIRTDPGTGPPAMPP